MLARKNMFASITRAGFPNTGSRSKRVVWAEEIFCFGVKLKDGTEFSAGTKPLY